MPDRLLPPQPASTGHDAPPRELLEFEFTPLLQEPFASAFAAASVADPAGRGRLLQRVAASHEAARVMITARRRRTPFEEPAPGVRVHTLYRAEPARALRRGEPLRSRLIEIRPGGAWRLSDDARDHRECLVLSGWVRLGAEDLGARDFHVDSEGAPLLEARSDEGTLLFVRESRVPARDGDAPFTVRDAQAGWPEFAPGIRRRVLWQRDGEAALLYQAQPGAAVPQHDHGRDEECVMVEGELFLDDTLLQAGDYQLAPAGTHHVVTHTDTGTIVYAHGDLDMQFTP